MTDRELAQAVAMRVDAAGGRALYVGGVVRDALTDTPCTDIDIEVYGIDADALQALLAGFGRVRTVGAPFGVFGIEGSRLDIALPRREKCTGEGHKAFEVVPDPHLSPEEAASRRDFTINAMMRDVLSGALIDPYHGREDLEARVLRRVNPASFAEDPLRVFRAAQFAARLEAEIEPDTLSLMGRMAVESLSPARVLEETEKALLKAARPSLYFRWLMKADHLKEFFPELQSCAGVVQSPIHHPEGDVFEHTMCVIDQAARLRDQAQHKLDFMLSALFHDLGKVLATEIHEDGRVTAHGHEVLGQEMIETAMRRLTGSERSIGYVKNMAWLHMRPNMMAYHRSRLKKTRTLFDMSVCPEDLILLTKADASGMGVPYNDQNEVFLRERLEDYRAVMRRPQVTGKDLIAAGLKPCAEFSEWLDYAHKLHLAGYDKQRALGQVLAIARKD